MKRFSSIMRIRNKGAIDYEFLLKNTKTIEQLGEVEEAWITALQ